MREYKYMSLNDVISLEKKAEELKVSKVARSKRGFVTAYKKARIPDNLPIEWRNKRDLFIKRTLAAYNKNPTERRKISLQMWAYNP